MKEKAFTISAKLGIEVSTTINAESYEDALAQARKLSVTDFVTIPDNCWQDGEIDKISFISEDD